jgi:hypothetical protein
MFHLQLAAGCLEGVGHEARATIREHVRDHEGKGPDRLLEEGNRGGGGLVVLHGEVDPSRAAIDGHRQVALTGQAISVPQLGPVLHVQGDEAELGGLEHAMRLRGASRRGEAVEALGFQDAGDGVPVQVRQEVRDPEGEVELSRAWRKRGRLTALLARL